MDNMKANQSIKCSVKDCEYDCQSQDYCGLDCISVGTHENNPTQKQCTDCESFERKMK